MTTKALLQRVEALERRQAPGAVVVCWCSKHNGRLNVDDHEPGCPALAAGDNDHVFIVRYEDAN